MITFIRRDFFLSAHMDRYSCASPHTRADSIQVCTVFGYFMRVGRMRNERDVCDDRSRPVGGAIGSFFIELSRKRCKSHEDHVVETGAIITGRRCSIELPYTCVHQTPRFDLHGNVYLGNCSPDPMVGKECTLLSRQLFASSTSGKTAENSLPRLAIAMHQHAMLLVSRA